MGDLDIYRNLVGGKLQPAAAGRLMDAINPASGEPWARIPDSGREDAADAVAAAAAAYPAWAMLSFAERARYLAKAAEVFNRHRAELAVLEATDNGRPLHDTTVAASGRSSWDKAVCLALEAVTGKSVILDANTSGMTRREPYGVVAAIIPWNAPVALISSKASTALAAGNTVVAKPSEQASVAALRLGELLAEAFPPGVFNIVSGLGEIVGDTFVRHQDVRRITMTGSSQTGRVIQKAAAESLTSSIFELGGKSPNIIFADADLDRAAIGATTAAVFTSNAGQACVAGSRVLIQRPILDEMLARMRTIARSIKLGAQFDPKTRMGPLVSKEHFNRVTQYIEIGKNEAELVFGGRYGAELMPGLPGGYWVEPTLFLTDDNSTRICQEEIFGPVAALIPFDNDDEALAIANGSRFGLASAIWTKDVGRIHRFVRDLQAGYVWVNTYRQIRPELPFVGMKDSGYGFDSLQEFTREKSVVYAY